jgi:multiple sugar transport system permease protein
MRMPSLRAITLRDVATEAKLLLIGIPVLLWTMLPLYHLFLFAVSPKDSAFAGKLWPDHPTLRNFEIVFAEKHHFLNHFWLQLWNSVVIAVAIAALTLLVATAAAFAISRLKVPGGRVVMNLALFTYFIPAAFLAVPMYKTMGNYGLLNNQWSLILAMVTIASPYAIWVLKQASDKLPYELDEAAVIDGASPLQLFRLVYLPLMMPSLVAVGTYALLLAWNEYLYAFLLLSKDTDITLPVALGNFLSADDSPWELLMTTGLIYALPPAAIYYTFKRYMVSGLTAGAVKN